MYSLHGGLNRSATIEGWYVCQSCMICDGRHVVTSSMIRATEGHLSRSDLRTDSAFGLLMISHSRLRTTASEAR